MHAEGTSAELRIIQKRLRLWNRLVVLPAVLLCAAAATVLWILFVKPPPAEFHAVFRRMEGIDRSNEKAQPGKVWVKLAFNQHPPQFSLTKYALGDRELSADWGKLCGFYFQKTAGVTPDVSYVTGVIGVAPQSGEALAYLFVKVAVKDAVNGSHAPEAHFYNQSLFADEKSARERLKELLKVPFFNHEAILPLPEPEHVTLARVQRELDVVERSAWPPIKWPEPFRIGIFLLGLVLAAFVVFRLLRVTLRLQSRAAMIMDAERRHQDTLEQARVAEREAAARRAAEEADRLEHQRLQRSEELVRERTESAKRAAQAKRELEHRIALQRSPKHRRCAKDGLIYPHFLHPRCPKCGDDTAQGEILAVLPNHNRRDDRDPRHLAGQVAVLLSLNDFPGIGNALLEALMEPEQHLRPNKEATYIIQNIRRFVGRKYSIPPELTYTLPHRDHCLPYHQRTLWTSDAFPQLIIFAYVLGATWITLPPPHDSLLPYYTLMASRQREILEQVSRNYRENKPPERSLEEEIKSIREDGRQKGLDPTLIEAEVEYVRNQYLDGQG